MVNSLLIPRVAPAPNDSKPFRSFHLSASSAIRAQDP